MGSGQLSIHFFYSHLYVILLFLTSIYIIAVVLFERFAKIFIVPYMYMYAVFSSDCVESNLCIF